MGIDTKSSAVFFEHKGRVIRHMEKHQHTLMEYTYRDMKTRREFDVRDLPESVTGGVSRDAIDAGCREAHKSAITAAIEAGHDFKEPSYAALAAAHI